MTPWYLSVLHPSQFGGRPGAECCDEPIPLSLKIESAHLNNMDVIAHDQDREKCFDFIYLPFIAELAEALGLRAP
eukprot:11524206-Karenia_brevis.AAC.1